MKNVLDRVVQYPRRYKLNPVSGQTNVYDIEAEPGLVTEHGTVVDRELLMALQGFVAKETVFYSDYITETNDVGHVKTTTFNMDGSITENFNASGMEINKQIVFNDDGTISEVLV